jgi:hypothetical protein
MDLETEKHLTRTSDGTFQAQATLDGRPVIRMVVHESIANLNDPKVPPSDEEIQGVALFVEAAGELEREPFFGPDEKRGFSHAGDEQWTFELGDRFHFRSALISFRRIWMEKESSHFYRVANILWRYARSVEERVSISWAREFHSKHEREKKHPPLGVEVAGRDLINLWLNTVFAHGGGNTKRKHQRKDFDQIVSQYGQAPFEYAFRVTVYALGMQYIALSKEVAKPALRRWEDEFGLKPSFSIGSAFGTSTRERTKEGHIIVRRASSEFAANETFDQRLSRILERPKFREMKRLISFMDLRDNNLVRLVLSSSDFHTFARHLDYELKIVVEVSEEFSTYGKHFRASNAFGDWTTGFSMVLVYDDLLVVTTEKGLRLLNENLGNLKRVLIDDE